MPRSAQPGFPALPRAGAFDGDTANDILAIMGQGSIALIDTTVILNIISFPGVTVITKPGPVITYTLAAPLPGPQPVGDDGKTVTIYDGSGAGYFVQCPPNSVLLNKSGLNFSGAVAANITLQAWNGLWMVQGTPNGVTLS